MKFLNAILFTALILSFSANAQSENQFERELRLLESHEEAAMKRVETMGSDDMVTDSVSVGNAGVLKAEIPDGPVTEVLSPPTTQKTRRVRSR